MPSTERRRPPRPFAASAALLGIAACAAPQLPQVTDAAPPAVRVAAPLEGARIETPTPQIEVEYADDASGILVTTFRAFINGTDHSADFDHHSRGATGRISARRRLPLGENHLVVEVADRSGKTGRGETRFVNAAGGWLTVAADPGAAPARTVELVLDASGSMRDALGLTTRMDVAKEAIHSLIEAIPAGTPLGLRVFEDCGRIAERVAIAPVDRARFLAAVAAVEPAGGTPIVASLLESFEALGRVREGQRVAVLVTDGGESCQGSMDDAINRAKDAATRVIVIGFDIEDAGITQQLRALAEGTGGAFYDASAAEELRLALERSVLRLGYGVFDQAGNHVADGDVDGEPVELPVGTYQVRFATVPAIVVPEVVVGSLTETGVRLRRTAGGIQGEAGAPGPAAPGRGSRGGGW